MNNNTKHTILLIPQAYNFNFLNILPRNFTILTKNSSCKFNTSILRITSSVISKIIMKNPDTTQYDLDIEDENNILSKFERIYQGECVKFEPNDFKTSQIISSKLNLNGFPSFSNSNSYVKNPYAKNSKEKTSKWSSGQNISFKKGNFNKESLGFNKLNASPLFKNDIFKSNSNTYFICNNYNVKLDTNYINLIGKIDTLFTIQTKKFKYHCKIIGVAFSSVIRDFLIANPDNSIYEFDYEDENGEFKLISDLFNLKDVSLSSSNIYTIKEISEKLGIDYIKKNVDEMINLVEKISNAIDDQQDVIDSVTDFFDLLFHIKEKKVDYVAKFIEDSQWSQNENNIYEMVSIILHVALSNSELQPYLIDLICELDESESKLKSLIPQITKRTIKILKAKKMFENETSLIFSFAYQLYKRGLIPKKDILEELKAYKLSNISFVSWFLPEIPEIDNQIKIDFFNCNIISKQKRNFNPNSETKKFYSNGSKSIEEYKQIRDKGECDDIITKALRNDDVDTFQSIVSKSADKLLKNTNKKNMFEPFITDYMRYLNYAAAYGSIKCFKYMLLNDEKVDNLTFEMSIIGGNNELIRIVDNENSKLKAESSKASSSFFAADNEKSIINSIMRTIQLHRNDLFDWILEKNNKMITNTQMINLVIYSLENGNMHSFIYFLDNGFEFNDYQSYYPQFMRIATEKGFYYLALFIINLINFDIDNKVALDMLTSCILIESHDILFQIIDKVNIVCPLNSALLCQLLENRHRADKTEIYKKIAQIAFENEPDGDFTLSYINAIEYNLKELLENFIEKKYSKNDEIIANKISTYGSINSEIFVLMMNNINPDFKKKMIRCIDDAVKKRNKPLLKVLLNEDAPIENCLILSIFTFDIEIINMILDKNSEPSYVNKLSNSGTALYIATVKNKVQIVSKLLSIPGIDPSLYYEKFMTPLIYSASTFNTEIFDLIYDFYGENIKEQKWQLKLALQMIIDNYLNISGPSFNDTQKTSAILFKIAKANAINPNKQILYKSNTKGITPFLFACQIDSIETVKLFIQNYKKIDVNIYSPDTGDSPLILSLRKNYKEIAKMLIECPKTDINFANFSGDTALLIAVNLHQYDLSDLILKSKNFDPIKSKINQAFFNSNLKKLLEFDSLDVNYIPSITFNSLFESNNKKEVKTPFLNSIITNDVQLFELIVKHPSFNATKTQLIDAAYVAFEQNKTTIFPKIFGLLEKFNIDINSPVFNGNNLLLESIKKNFNENRIAEVLNFPKFDSKKSDIVKAFKQVFNAFNTSKDKDTKFQGNITSTFMKTNVLDLLYDYDSSHDCLIKLKEVNEEGNSLLSTLFDCIFTNGGIDPNQQYNDLYPLEHAIQNNLYILSLCLINSQKVDFNVNVHKSSDVVFHGFGKKIDQVQSKSNYLDLIIESNRDKILKEFLSHHCCDVNIVNDEGETPLMIACRKNRIECIKLLFEMDDLNFLYRNTKGEDALQILRNKNKNQSGSDVAISDKNQYLNELLKLAVSSQKVDDLNKSNQKKIWNEGVSNGWGSSSKNQQDPVKSESSFSFSRPSMPNSDQNESSKFKRRFFKSQGSDETNQQNAQYESHYAYSFRENKEKQSDTSNELNQAEPANNEKDSSAQSNQTKPVNNEKDSSAGSNQAEPVNNEKDSSAESNQTEPANNEKDSSAESIKTGLPESKAHESSAFIQRRQIKNELSQTNQSQSIAKIKTEISPLVSFQVLGNDSPKSQLGNIKESFREKLDLGFHQQANPIRKIHRKTEHSFDENVVNQKTRKAHRSSLAKRRSRKLYEDSFINDEEFDETNQYSQYQQQQQQQQQQFMILQQQQQQWFQMIQMNNELQAQINFQMMNQNQLNKKKQKQTKKKKSK